MQKLRAILGGSSPIAMTALVSVLVLGGVTTARVVATIRPPVSPPVVAAAVVDTTNADESADWQQQMLLLGQTTETDASAATSTDHLALIGPMVMGEIFGTYDSIRASGNYTQTDLRAAAEKIGSYMKAAVAYEAFEITDFATDADASSERVRTYRAELQSALEPLASIPGAEYEIYGRYVETSDSKYLEQLRDAANKYRSSAASASLLTVPRDAVNYHRDLLNSLRAFASVLDGLAGHADDPYASIALLRTYNEKEQGIYDSFNRMRSYYAKKEL